MLNNNNKNNKNNFLDKWLQSMIYSQNYQNFNFYERTGRLSVYTKLIFLKYFLILKYFLTCHHCIVWSDRHMALSDKQIHFVFYLDIHVKLCVVDFYDIVFDKMYESVELLISLGKSLTHICQSCEYLNQIFKLFDSFQIIKTILSCWYLCSEIRNLQGKWLSKILIV